jgi:hypothetical protein
MKFLSMRCLSMKCLFVYETSIREMPVREVSMICQHIRCVPQYIPRWGAGGADGEAQGALGEPIGGNLVTNRAGSQPIE